MRKTFFIVAFILCMTQVFSQSLSIAPYYSSEKSNILGAQIHVGLDNSLIVGIGGAFALRTYNGTSKTYEEDIHRLQEYPMNSRDVLSTFNYYTKDVYGVLGYQLGKISLTTEWGVAWRVKYWICNSHLSGSTVMLPDANPSGAYFTWTKLPNRFLVGGSVTIPIHDKYGLFLGYNSVEKFRAGVHILIKQSRLW